nr:hypothetical protein GCM10020093_007930 [Planobispora longispora]
MLEALVGEKPYDRLKTFKHPHGLPFSLDAARFTTYLKYLGVDPVEFSLLFAARVDPDRVTRDYLGLTTEDVDLLSVPRPDAASLAEAYGLKPGKPARGGEPAEPAEPVSALCDVDRFLAATSLTGAELYELLYQDPKLERSRSGFWVHQGAVVDISADGRRLVLRDSGDSPDDPPDDPPHEWFDRTHRFVRLARGTGLSFTDLDRVAAGLSIGLHPVTLRAVAAAVHLHRTHDAPFDLIEALITRTLPNKIKDGPFPAGDILAPQNRPYRRDLARHINLPEKEIVEVVRRLRARYAGPLEESPFDRGIGRPGLVVLNRVARLTGALGMSVEELFTVLAALEADPAIERRSTFPVLPVLDGGTGDVHRLLETDENPAASLWLAQTVFEVVAWMRTWGFAAEDLTAILGEPATPESEEEQAQVIAGIAEHFADVALTPGSFVSDRFDERASRVLYEALTAYPDGVVSPHDPRLLRIDPAAVPSAAHHAVGRLAVLTEGDFLGLGLGDRLTGKIFTNLVIRGVIQADGLLASEDLPAALTLAGDFSAHRETLFGAIAALGDAFYPSDLAAALPRLTEADRAELYDNLVHNGYLSEEGEVLDPEMFADPGQRAASASTRPSTTSHPPCWPCSRAGSKATGRPGSRSTRPPSAS